MKRFTETEKWRDSWFQGLSPDSKLAFWYITETCDGAGVWDPNEKMAEFSIGKKIDWEKVYREFGSKMRRLPCGKLYLVNFVVFQYGELTETCKPHLKVMKLLQQHGITKGMDTLSLPLDKGMDTLKEEEEDKDKETEKEKDSGAGKTITPRNPLLDALATVGGGDPLQVTAWAGHATALKQIKAVCSDLTVYEIRRRGENYRTHFENAALTSTALSKHWATCAGPKEKRNGHGQLEARFEEAF